nr:unnamed protein product [Spirometra erinaceieuropaei]
MQGNQTFGNTQSPPQATAAVTVTAGNNLGQPQMKAPAFPSQQPFAMNGGTNAVAIQQIAQMQRMQQQQQQQQKQRQTAMQMIPASVSAIDSENAAFAGFRRLLAELKAKKFDQIRFAAYRTASKLRYIQKRTLLGSLDIWRVVETFRDVGLHLADPTVTLNRQGTEQLLWRIYASLPPPADAPVVCDASGQRQILPLQSPMLSQAAEILLGWLTYILDPTNCGRLAVSGLKVALSTLAGGKPADKFRYHFTLLTNPAGVLQIPRLETYLQELLSLAVGVFEEPNFSYNAQTSKFIITGRSKNILVEEFLERMLAEPGPQTFSWLKVFHRMAIVENVRHPVKCEGCKREPIIGLRYKCTRCPRYNLCQDCFWTGITTDAHTNSHDVKEYTASTKQHSRQFGHSLRKSFQFVRQHSTVGSGASSSSEATSAPMASEAGTVPRTIALAPCGGQQQRLSQGRPPGFPPMQQQQQQQQHKLSGAGVGNMRYPPVRMNSYDCSLPMQMSYYCAGPSCAAPGPPRPVPLGPGSHSLNDTIILQQQQQQPQPFYPHFAGSCVRPGRPPNTPVLSHAREARQPVGMQPQAPTVSEVAPTPFQSSNQQRPAVQPTSKVPQNGEEMPQQGMLAQQEQPPQRTRLPSVGPLPANQRLTQRHHSMPEGPHPLVLPESPATYRALSVDQDGKPIRTVAPDMNNPEANHTAVWEGGTLNRGGAASISVPSGGRSTAADALPATVTPADDSAPGRGSGGGGGSQPVDEHSMIANYAARLAALKSLNGQFGDMNNVFDCTQTQKQLVAQLEAKNREILLEIQRLRLEQQQQAAGIAAAMVAGGRQNVGGMRPGLEPGAAGDGRSDTLGRHPESEDPQLMAELQALRQRKSTLEARMNDLQGNRRDLMIQLETLMRLLKTGSDNYQSHEEVLSFPPQPLPSESGGGFEGSLSRLPPGLVSYYTQSRYHGGGGGMNPPRRSSSLVRRSRGDGSLDHLPTLLHRSFDAESVLRANTTETPFLEPSGDAMCSLRRPYGRPKAFPPELPLSPRHGFERSGSQPPSLECGSSMATATSTVSGTFTRPRTASQSYAHQRGALTPTADTWRSSGTLGRPPVHPKVTTSASTASPYRSAGNAKPPLATADSPGSGLTDSPMNQSVSNAKQAVTSCSESTVTATTKLTIELNGRPSAMPDDGRDSDDMKRNIESKDFVTMSVKGQTQRPSFVDGSVSEQQTFIDSDGESMSRRRSPNAFDSGSEAYLYSDPELLGTWGSKNRKANTSTGTAVTSTSVTLSTAASTNDGSIGQIGKSSGPSSTSYASLPSYVSSLLTGSTPSTAGNGMTMAARSKGTPAVGNFSAVTTPTTTTATTFGGATNVSDGSQSFLSRLGSVRSRKPHKPDESSSFARN